jgi:hypothetical protein
MGLKDQKNKQLDGKADSKESSKKWIKPRIVTYTSEQLVERVGPALACSGGAYCGTGT